MAIEGRSLGDISDARVREFLRLARLGHLATSSQDGVPHNIPICFWFDDAAHIYFVIDEKPKRLTGTGLKRMRNIAENRRVALVIDHYEEDWACLAYVLIHGEAHIVDDSSEYMLALRSLRDKYPQYRVMMLSVERNPMVRIDAIRVHTWGERFKPAPSA
ncbi:MAG TPA: TIGR03668 family PPOX class F420-dependent oxidoreductase [Candidatus Binataceae bacterium]|nr:TIGR03668 family PPOX class F420-dependent oxidoreductase [Candidatus Binataceae bacterium]